MLTPRAILEARIREWLASDLGPFRTAGGAALYAAATAWLTAGRRADAYRMYMRIHSGHFSDPVDRRIEAIIREATDDELRGVSTGLFDAYQFVINQAVAGFRTAANADPRRLLGTRVLVGKSAQDDERGLIYIDYSYVFAALAGLFDLESIARRYWLVLEPSWSGVLMPEIFLYSRLRQGTFVQTIEPRDHRVLIATRSGLEPIPVAANYWVDYRAIQPGPSRRDIDVIMVAAWAAIKRHWRFFKALSALRQRGHRLNVALIGYKYDLTKDDILEQARYFGVADQISLHEGLTQAEVSALLARSKIHVLWSRRECANRAIIEAMLADVPVIVREGLTFGFEYPYINRQTGRFVSEGDLADAILEMIDQRQSYRPREWVLEHMTPQRATATVEERVRAVAAAQGEPWREGVIVKTSSLHEQKYWSPADRDRFEPDYRFLESRILASSARLMDPSVA